jgi:hypothetical protein
MITTRLQVFKDGNAPKVKNVISIFVFNASSMHCIRSNKQIKNNEVIVKYDEYDHQQRGYY